MATTAPPAAGRPQHSLYIRLLQVLNNVLHWPLVDDVAFFLYHFVQLCLGPLYAVGLVVVFVAKLLSGSFWPRYEAPQGRSVVITGCDSGFGHSLALALVRKGWVVYAGCLSPQGCQALQDKAAGSAGSMRAVAMDVTKQADIDRVAKQVAEECPGGLFALVNNAGVGVGGLVDWQPMELYRKILEVNLFAMIATCKAFLPQLKESQGRIVNVTSMAGLFLGAPCMSAYSASKHAAEAFTTSLRFEVAAWGIKVITLNPSFHETNIATNAAATVQKSYDALDAQMQADYGPEYLQAAKDLTESQTVGCWDAQNVVNALVKAATASNPRTQYIVGSDATFYLLPLLHFPTPMVEWVIAFSKMQPLVPAKMKKKNGGKPAATKKTK